MAFHGFNRNPDDFQPFSRWLGTVYTILAFDLFYHGRSETNPEDGHLAISYTDIRSLIDAVLARYGKHEFELIAYSFGGRFALNILEIYQERVKGLYLMAPDALRMNPGFYFVAKTLPGRWLFRKYLDDPSPAIRIMKLLSGAGFYNKKAMDFYISHLSFAPMRSRVYRSWLLHRNTIPNLNRVAAIIKKNNTRVLLFFGKYDMIIPPALGLRFANRIGKPGSLYLLETGHRLPEMHREISRIILERSS